MIVVTESTVWNWEHGRAHLMKKAWELRFEAPQKKLKQGPSFAKATGGQVGIFPKSTP